jgi:hypothetical protein
MVAPRQARDHRDIYLSLAALRARCLVWLNQLARELE